jgi:hypothetical protein
MKNLLCFMLLIASVSAFSQNEKFSTAFINRLTPTFPGCENAADQSKCYHIGVGNLIVAELNKTAAIKDEKIQVQLLLKTESDGKTTVMRVKHKNPEVVETVQIALSKLPLITPLKSKTTGKNEVSSDSFFVTAIRNKQQQYELFYN